MNYDERKKEMEKSKEEEDPMSTSLSSELKSPDSEFNINEIEKLKNDPYMKEGLKLLIALTKMQVG